MEFVAMFNKLLFPVLAWIDWGLEIPNFRCLEYGQNGQSAASTSFAFSRTGQ